MTIRIYDSLIAFRVSTKQLNKIKDEAKQLDIGLSEFLRMKALDKPLDDIRKSKQILDMSEISGNLGKIGGLFALWVKDYNRANYAKELDVPFLIEELKNNQKELRKIISEIKLDDYS